jgi:hypothetical protein
VKSKSERPQILSGMHGSSKCSSWAVLYVLDVIVDFTERAPLFLFFDVVPVLPDTALEVSEEFPLLETCVEAEPFFLPILILWVEKYMQLTFSFRVGRINTLR